MQIGRQIDSLGSYGTCATAVAAGVAAALLGGAQIALALILQAQIRATVVLSDVPLVPDVDRSPGLLLLSGLFLGGSGLLCLRHSKGLALGRRRALQIVATVTAGLLGWCLAQAPVDQIAAITATLAATTLAGILLTPCRDYCTATVDVVTRVPERTVTVAEAFDATSAASAQLI